MRNPIEFHVLRRDNLFNNLIDRIEQKLLHLCYIYEVEYLEQQSRVPLER